MKKVILLVSLGMILLFACKNEEAVVTSDITPVEDAVEAIKPNMAAEMNPKDTLLFYRRTACFGMCPSFDFAVHRSGDAFYEGRNFVDLIGTYQGATSQESIDQVIAKAKELRYDTLQNVYDNRFVTDLPSVQTEINGKLVVNRYQGPNLKELYTVLDSMIARIEWTPKADNK